MLLLTPHLRQNTRGGGYQKRKEAEKIRIVYIKDGTM
jgi:hypothetical protein